MSDVQSILLKLSGLLATIILLSSCFNYKVFAVKDRIASDPAAVLKKAFIVNRDQSREAEILLHANMYQITQDSLDQQTIRLCLSPLTVKHRDDGPGIIISVLTLGQVPVLYRDVYSFSFTETKSGSSESKTFDLHVGKQYWFWNVFVFKKQFNRKAGLALSNAYRYH